MAPRRQRLTTLVLTGVSGVGKTAVLTALHDRLGWPAIEGDELHSAASIAKMAAGIPLTDADRAPWLEAIAERISELERARSDGLVACSALRRRYRDQLRRGHPSVWFVQLTAPPAVLAARLQGRHGHFMPPSLLGSQLDALEPLEPDEPGWILAASGSPAELAAAISRWLGLEPG